MVVEIAYAVSHKELHDLSARWLRTRPRRLRRLVWHQPVQHLVRELEALASLAFLLRLHEDLSSRLSIRHYLHAMFPAMFPMLTGAILWECRGW